VEATLERPRVDDSLVRRVRGEYVEMPGLSPTLAQAQRLFGLDETTCRAVLEGLVEAGILVRTTHGRYVLCSLAWEVLP
jgi:hypothetical protein